MDGTRWNWPVTVSADLLVLKNSCADYLLDINREDVISWTQSKTGVFTVSSAWNSIRPLMGNCYQREILLLYHQEDCMGCHHLSPVETAE